MTDYDSMSVEDLILELVNDVVAMGATTRMKSAHFPTIESALRRAVIREASVGEATMKITEYEDEITAPVGSPDRIVTCSEQLICPHWVPPGTYFLIKKEE
jgi:hypothetical protein